MDKDEIMQALRLLAMGRVGHPLQEQLADELARVFASALPVRVEVPACVVTDAAVVEAKRRKKAD
jgi:hypothetical protein